MNKLLRRVTFFFFLINVALGFLFFLLIFPLLLPTLFFDKRRVIFTYFSCLSCRYFLWSSYFWKIKYIHNDNLKPKQTYIYVANHQSLLDILAVFFIKYRFRFVAKKVLFSVPLVGLYMTLSQFIPILRQNKKSIQKMFELAKRHLRRKNSLLFFPEGRRVLDDTVKPFKKGAFTLAVDHNIPIVPVAIHCIKKSMMEKIFNGKGKETITVKVFDPIFPSKEDTAESLAKKSHEIIAEELRLGV